MTLVTIEDQYSIINFTQFEAGIWAHHSISNGGTSGLLWLWFKGCKCKNSGESDGQCHQVKYMQPMWLCIPTGRQFEETFENTQWWKVKNETKIMWFAFTGAGIYLRRHLNKKNTKMKLYSLLTHMLRIYLNLNL